MTTAPAPESTEHTPTNGNGQEDEGLGTQSTIETVGPCKRKIKAEVPTGKVEKELDRNYKELISTVQIPGFRRGHVPRRLLEKRYGSDIESDVKETLLELSFQEVVKEKELKILGRPKFENVAFSKEAPLRYEVEVEVRPEFEVGSYTGIEIDWKDPTKVEDSEVEERIADLQRQLAQVAAIDPSEAGPDDLYVGHYALERDGLRLFLKTEVGFKPSLNLIDGIAVEGLAEKVKDRGSSSTIAAEVTVPADYAQEVLRGQQASLTFTIEETKRLQLHPADDELAKQIDVPSIGELRASLRKRLEERNRLQADEELELRAIDKVADALQFDLPEGLLGDQLQLSRMRLEFSLAQEGAPREKIEEALKEFDARDPGTELRRDFKRFFVLEKIADAEKVFATEEEVEKRIALLARSYGRAFREVYEELEKSDRLETIRAEIRHQKVKRFLREKAKVNGAPVSAAAAPAAAAPTTPAPSTVEESNPAAEGGT